MRRRRANSSTNDSSSSTIQEGSPSDGSVTRVPNRSKTTSGRLDSEGEAPIKTVDELVQEEGKSFTQFLGLCGIVTVVFLFLIQSTKLPPPRQVFAVMIDAGSTGTRAQIFKFIHDEVQDRLILKDTEMHTIKKSIAALGTGMGGTGAQFFRPLIDKAKKSVPGLRRRKRTPIVLRATAGLRMLGADAAYLALQHSREALNASGFLFLEKYAGILDHRQEATFGWTSVNHLLGRIGVGEVAVSKAGPPVAIMELGGASLQVVYAQSDTKSDDEGSIVKATTHKVTFGPKSYSLRVGAFHGLGLVEYTKRMYRVFDAEGVLEEGNPCFRNGKTISDKLIRIGFDADEEERRVTIVGDGDFDRCVASAEIVIASTLGQHESLGKLPKNSIVYAYAFFYDRTVGFGIGANATKSEMVKKGVELCEGSGPGIGDEFDEACAQYSYVYALVKTVTDNFSKERNVTVRFEQYVDGHMLGWALGAVLDVIEPHMHSQISLDSEPLTIS